MDTAGRLQNRAELMGELEKIIRVMKKVDPEAPHAVLLVLDATVGQNALSQVEIFGRIAGVTGLVMTKLDGTARGGILVAIADKFAPAGAFHRRRRGRRRSRAVRRPRFRRGDRRGRASGGMKALGWRGRERDRGPPPYRGAKALSPIVKFALELGPLVLFFVANSRPGWFHGLVGGLLPEGLAPEKVGMLTATSILMVTAVVAVAISWALTRRVPIVPVVTMVMVLVFGALTLWLQDKTFIEIKLTLVYCLLGGALLGAMAFGKMLLPIVLESAIRLDRAGWRMLTIRWGLFFFSLAALNEILRHLLTWDQWVAFKSFGVLPLTLVFAVAQTPLIMRHEAKEDAFADEI